jgi:phosphonoacetaldehyde hydrolase
MQYRGPLKAVIFDWAGTTVDYGSRAPVVAFVRTFQQFGIVLSEAEARGPMGLGKRDHIQALGLLPRIAQEWQRVHGRPFGEPDVDALYAAFGPISTAVAVDYAEPIPGVVELMDVLRHRGMAIGSTTGYGRLIMSELAPRAAALGFRPDCVVCPDDVPMGRPSPLMMYRCFVELGVWPAEACVKVDDTVPGIAEGLAAGSWTVGVAVSGNGVGLSADEIASLSELERAEHTARAVAALANAGAHAVIDSVAGLLPVPEVIERCTARGEAPAQLGTRDGAQQALPAKR